MSPASGREGDKFLRQAGQEEQHVPGAGIDPTVAFSTLWSTRSKSKHPPWRPTSSPSHLGVDGWIQLRDPIDLIWSGPGKEKALPGGPRPPQRNASYAGTRVHCNQAQQRAAAVKGKDKPNKSDCGKRRRAQVHRAVG